MGREISCQNEWSVVHYQAGKLVIHEDGAKVPDVHQWDLIFSADPQPAFQFRGKGENHSSAAGLDAAHGKLELAFPALGGAHARAQVPGNFLPRAKHLTHIAPALATTHVGSQENSGACA